MNGATRGGLRRRRLADTCATAAFGTIAAAVSVLVLALIGIIAARGVLAVSPHFLTASPDETSPGGGIGPEVFNSLYLLVLSLACTLPPALGTAMYLVEYAKPGRFTSVVEFALETLATVPSIVIGLFGLLIFVYLLHWRFSALGGALTLTILNLPAMVRVSQQALRGVPASLREASLALGATRWRTVTRVVLPAASASLITGVILVAGRIFGETAALIYTAGVSVSAAHPYDFSPFHEAETLSVHLWYTHAEGTAPDAARIGDGAAFVLLFMVLLFNASARGIGALLTHRGRSGS